ncbi:Beta-1,3 glucanase 4 [Heracleum sosnowskyi]|uniref:Beta-1,3 glucanase 4 n=1 Tax=Heracleum sosnowskyi TaxID=360622 RepID=A0AAD8I7N3_9APIA|nr:Beta-1,3 glucanase 4 [Heracleum sosnowskyi]
MNSFVWILTGLLLDLATSQITPSGSIGVNFGTLGNNLPSPQDVKNLYGRCKIQQMRLFEPNSNILEALRHSGLSVCIGVKNNDIPSLSNFNDPKACIDWLNTNVVPYKNDVTFKYITMGNEVIPGPLAQYLPNAINNMYNALNSLGLGKIMVTTVVPTNVLQTSFPPSAGAFTPDTFPILGDIISFFYGNNIPLMVNVYPYFSYAADPAHISLEYATFLSKTPVVVDGQFRYYNLFDASVDAFHAAIEKVNVGNISLAISETGWPTVGNDPYASKENAEIYNTNLVNHVTKNGTPRRPGKIMDTFIFAMFNENQKAPGVEQNFGLFYPSMQSVYPLFSC